MVKWGFRCFDILNRVMDVLGKVVFFFFVL